MGRQLCSRKRGRNFARHSPPVRGTRLPTLSRSSNAIRPNEMQCACHFLEKTSSIVQNVRRPSRIHVPQVFSSRAFIEHEFGIVDATAMSVPGQKSVEVSNSSAVIVRNGRPRKISSPPTRGASARGHFDIRATPKGSAGAKTLVESTDHP